ncbi:aldolase/citrate lyase family protein [Bosea sp. (in: a-proteobacteria)]|uniref:aldolase/citrate lyase family protein n=1 Tax=Bosea sp. (in: a-proteobacteria) TaxID=1871050 RepID=UPI0025C4F8A9|nr:aldolase/citrate lyase family protein [Bosea sp. (in: a-proteobacteria)]
MQVETGEALERREEIASFESVDGGFIGPAHLAASLGHVGDPGHPTVVAAVADVIRRTRATGKPAGNLTTLLVWC